MMSAFIGIQVNEIAPELGGVPLTQTPGIGIQCPNGIVSNLNMLLAPASSGIAIPFPNGATTATFVYIFASTTTDLIIKTGAGLIALPVLPFGMGQIFYGLASAQITLNSVLGGSVQFVVGG